MLPNSITARLLAIPSMAMLAAVAMFMPEQTAVAGLLGLLHAGLLFGPSLFSLRELRRYYYSIWGTTLLSGALAFYFHNWLLAGWLCLLAGISLAGVTSSQLKRQSLANTLEAVFCFILLFFVLIPRILLLDQQQGWPDFTWMVLGNFAIWAVAYAVTVVRVDRPAIDPVFCTLFALLCGLIALACVLAALLSTTPSYFLSTLAVFVVASLLALTAWILWSPSLGGGLSTVFFRHMLSLSVPFDDWMKEMTLLANDVTDVEEFWRQSMGRLLFHTGLIGISWDESGRERLVGEKLGSQTYLPLSDWGITLYSSRSISPTKLFNKWLLARVALEFRQSKQRENRFTAEATMRSVHELGARTTHDIKNILHAITLLCASGDSASEFSAKQKEQLRSLAGRLETSLNELRGESLATVNSGMMPVKEWWENAQRRVASPNVKFVVNMEFSAQSGDVPADLFDRTLENLVHNSLRKQASEGEILVAVEIGDGPALTVRDNGSQIPAQIQAKLFNAPLPSSEGMGIGLFQLALNAQRLGYQFFVESNSPGDVAFRLEPS